jgi:hypothetical protein
MADQVRARKARMLTLTAQCRDMSFKKFILFRCIPDPPRSQSSLTDTLLSIATLTDRGYTNQLTCSLIVAGHEEDMSREGIRVGPDREMKTIGRCVEA